MNSKEKRQEMPISSRQAAYCSLHTQLKNGILPRGAIKKTAELFSVDASTMGKFWRKTNKKNEENNLVPTAILTDLAFFKTNSDKRGRQKKWDREELKEEIQKNVPFNQRKTFWSMAKITKVPKSTLHYMYETVGLFRRHTSSLKPHLIEENKTTQFFHALDEVYPVAGADGVFCFKDLYDCVDVNEKWFYLIRVKENYILIAGAEDDDDGGETSPLRSVRNRSHTITKVMFLCAQARPHWDVRKHEMWDGKLGMWPVVGHWALAKRQSANREAGAPVWKEETINQPKYRKLLLEKVVPAIAEKWPRREWEDARFIIWIQQDGAAAHIHSTMDEGFWQGMENLGYHNKILLYMQPENSPDTNINDLGFFRALQSMYHESCPNDEAQIVEYVQRAYNDYDLNKS